MRLFLLLFATFTFAFAQDVSLRLFVHPAQSMIDSSTAIYISGDKKELGNWNPSAVSLSRLNDSLWMYEGKFSKGLQLRFKITGGSWEQEAMYDSVEVSQNFNVSLTHDTTMTVNPIGWKNKFYRSKSEPRIQGNVVYHRKLKGEGLNYSRDVIVWLPPSYQTEKKRRYPVLYMHDGQNIFDPSTSFSGKDWRVDEIADSLIAVKAMEEIIIVGIYNSPDRLQEYSDSPLGQAYMNFVIDDVKPMIDSAYRTKPSKKNTAIMGSSMGGLISLIMMWKYPGIVGMAGCLSTSFWYDDEKTLKEFKKDSWTNKNSKIYIDCGGREKELLKEYKQMIPVLKKKGFIKGENLEYHLEEKAAHNEYYWSQRVWRPLLFMFGK